MQINSHKAPTVVASLLGAVQEWMRREDFSRETVAMQIIEAHERINGPRNTRIVFDPPSRDLYERAKVNADRIFRWLDEVTKDRNLVPPNFIPSVLAALPMDLRIEAGNALLAPADMACRPVGGDTPGAQLSSLFKSMLREGSEAQMAVAELLDGATPAELEHARTELTENIAASQKLLAAVEKMLQEGQR